MARDLESLIANLSANDAGERLAAAEKLSQLAEDAAPAAVALVRALDDSDEQVRQLANSALEDCGSPEQQAVDDLEALLASSNPDCAYWAATLLGRLEGGAVQAVETLKATAADHPVDAVRQRATWALSKIATG